MRVRFYKGPLHGKTRDIDPRDLRGGSLFYAHVDKWSRIQAVSYMADPLTSEPVATFRSLEYRIKMMAGSIDNQYFSGPAVHPDGSVFLEYVEPRKKK